MRVVRGGRCSTVANESALRDRSVRISESAAPGLAGSSRVQVHHVETSPAPRARRVSGSVMANDDDGIGVTVLDPRVQHLSVSYGEHGSPHGTRNIDASVEIETLGATAEWTRTERRADRQVGNGRVPATGGGAAVSVRPARWWVFRNSSAKRPAEPIAKLSNGPGSGLVADTGENEHDDAERRQPLHNNRHRIRCGGDSVDRRGTGANVQLQRVSGLDGI